MPKSTYARLVEKIDVLPSGCWAWTAHRLPTGYGHFKAEGKMRRAHRVSYELFVGPIDDGLELHHRCFNRWCVAPHHLDQVTHGKNISESWTTRRRLAAA